MLHSASLSAISYCLFCSFLKVSHAIDNISYISHHSLSPFIAHSLVLLLLYARLIHYYYHTSFTLLFVAIVRAARFILSPMRLSPYICLSFDMFAIVRAAHQLLLSYFFHLAFCCYCTRGLFHTVSHETITISSLIIWYVCYCTRGSFFVLSYFILPTFVAIARAALLILSPVSQSPFIRVSFGTVAIVRTAHSL